MSKAGRGCIVLAVAASLAACSTAPLRVVVDPSLADSEVFEVSGRTNRYWGRPIHFGGFATKETRVGSTWNWTVGLFDLGAGVERQPYRFGFVDEGGAEWQVECRATTPILRQSNDRGSWTVPVGETHLGCAIRDPAQRVHSLRVAGTGLEFQGESGSGAELGMGQRQGEGNRRRH